MERRIFGVGKLDQETLSRLVLTKLGRPDRNIIVGPTLGEDAAILRMDRNLLAIHTDPVTGASSRIGWIAVMASTNDIYSKGITPRFLSVVILLPPDTTETSLAAITSDIEEAAMKVGAGIIGGHTEISRHLTDPIVVCTAIGETSRGRYVTSSGGHPGDNILMTKGAAIEGTAIVAHDLPHLLKGKVSSRVQSRARKFIDELSISREAETAMATGGVTAMHDVTEGGVLCAIQEVAAASKCGFQVVAEEIPVRSETGIICEALSIDPLKTIGSGSLIITVDKQHVEPMLRNLRASGIAAAAVGTMEDIDRGQVLIRERKMTRLTRQVQEELWRILH